MMEVCEGRSMVMRCIKEGNKFRKKLLKVSSPTSEFRDMVSCVTDVKTKGQQPDAVREEAGFWDGVNQPHLELYY